MGALLTVFKPYAEKIIGVGLIGSFILLGLWYYGHIRYQAGVKDENIRWTSDQQKIADQNKAVEVAIEKFANEIDTKTAERLANLQIINKTVVQPVRSEIHEKLVYSNPDCRVTPGLLNAWASLSNASGYDPRIIGADGKPVPLDSAAH